MALLEGSVVWFMFTAGQLLEPAISNPLDVAACLL